MSRNRKPPQADLAINSFPPISVRNEMPLEHQREMAEQQRAHLTSLAQRIERGETLTPHERKYVAANLRSWAGVVGSEIRRKPGRPRTMDPGTIAMRFGWLVKVDGETQENAVGQLADEYGVSDEAVRKALRTNQRSILAWYESQTTNS